MKKQVFALSMAALGAVSITARAADDAGPYVGASVGASRLTAGAGMIDRAFASQGLSTSTSLDRNDTSYALTLGYRVNPYFAVEGNYVDLGRFDYRSGVSSPAADTLGGKFKSSGFDLLAVGIVPLNAGFSAYGKLGALWSDTKLEASSGGAVAVSDKSHSDVSATYGLGLSYAFTRNVSGNLEWNRYNRLGDPATTGRSDANVYSVGVAYHF